MVSKQLINSGIRFLRDLQTDLGTEIGLAVWDKLREAMGDEISGQVLFGILKGNMGDTIRLESVVHGRLINTIKIVREFTGIGLKDAKDLVERVLYNPGHIEILHARRVNYDGLPIENIDLNHYIERLQNEGAKVS